MDLKKLSEINLALKRQFGSHSDGRPHWRVVLNDQNLREKRLTQGWRFDEHGNYLGENEGVQDLPKYTYIPYGIYILEQLYFTDHLPYDLDVVEANRHGTYEPRWPFMTREFKYLEPSLEGCIFVIQSNTAIERGKRKIKTQKDLDRDFRNKLFQGIKEIEPAFHGNLHSRPYLASEQK